MKVSDIMTPAAIYDAPDDTLAEAAAKMWQQQTGSLLIMEGDALGGIVTERDVLRVLAEGHEPKAISVRDVMTSNPVTIGPNTTLRDAAAIMFDKWFRHLPVVDDGGKVLGIISLRDLLSLVAEGMQEPEQLQVLTGHKLVRDKRLDRVEAGDLD
ncbi:MAG TPA: CBS domain-containing protein [Actinomycetota bacterium]|jgi:CBS domain-containing protein